ncbi:nitrogen fixation protein NifZ [Acerihabitans arboris]|uniref:Nitrogen fixation protein NifZ n=1 Tax=Acerihabitans arboris TaxID=2691583 RepID=A0A845SI49_9GAMM|nr:nitrogen fixation protein NifZ [Acerihabitans arboris]NDL62957.1 nitrogen fixation protein NifZ [Acerihabitans arboris]
MKPTYEFGDRVRVIRSLRNDGTFPGKARGAMLVRKGSIGYVREWGTFLQDNIIYQVHFVEEDCIVGCREHELVSGEAPWIAGQFQFGDWVSAALPLAINGEPVVTEGQVGQIMDEIRDFEPMAYVVLFEGRLFRVPEQALAPRVCEP